MHEIFLLANYAAEIGLWAGLKNLMVVFLEKLFEFTLAIQIPSYALAIFIFTLILKIVLYPLTLKQMRSTQKMQRIQPLAKEIEKKYKGNPQRHQEEIAKLYKTYGINPLSGCLPLLVQMPIMIALYRVLMSFEPQFPEYYTFLWLKNLSLPDPTGIALPVIVAAATFAQQYLTITNRQDTTQKTMLYVMPIMFGFFARNFAAGLAIYWISYSLIGAVQQIFINRRGKKEVEAIEAKIEEERQAKQEKKQSKAEKKRIHRRGTAAPAPQNPPKTADNDDDEYEEVNYEDIKPYDRKPKRKKKAKPQPEDETNEVNVQADEDSSPPEDADA